MVFYVFKCLWRQRRVSGPRTVVIGIVCNVHPWDSTLVRLTETPGGNTLQPLYLSGLRLSSVLQVLSRHGGGLWMMQLSESLLFLHLTPHTYSVNNPNNTHWFTKSDSVCSFLTVLSRWCSFFLGLVSHSRYFQDSFSCPWIKNGAWIWVHLNYMWFVTKEELQGFMPFRTVLSKRFFCFLP